MSTQPFESPRPVDLFELASEAVTELTLIANSGVSDPEKVARLRRDLSEVKLLRAEGIIASKEVQDQLKLN